MSQRIFPIQYLELEQLSIAPSAPGTGRMLLYFKTDDKLYHRLPDGTETEVGGSLGVFIMTPYKLVSAASTNATSVSASARKVGHIACYNTHANPRYIKLYDKASAPTVGTDTPIQTLLIPGATTTGAGSNLPLAHPISLTNGLAFALTTGMADADTGAVGASEVLVNLGWST